MDRSNIYNIIHLSLSFVLIFMSYTVAQTFQTSSDYAKDGAFAIGIIYLVFCLSNLVLSSYITRLLGVRLTLILSSLTYLLFIAANIKYNRWMLYISAFLVGLGAAFIWTAQGVYVSVSINKHERINHLETSSTQGFINGLFFGVFQMNLTLGNLIAAFLFYLKYEQWIIFTIMTIIAGIGIISLSFLRPIKMPTNTTKYSDLGSLSMFFDIPFIFLIPTMCYTGLSQAFIFGTVPPLIINKTRKFLLFTLYGMVNTCGSICFGKLSDYLGRRLLLFAVGAVNYMIVYGLLLFVWKPPFDEDRIEIYIIMIICFSIADSIFITQLYSIIAILYGETRPAEAFACMRVFQAGCTAVGFVGQVYSSISFQIFCLIITLSLSFITLMYENYGIISLDTGKNTRTLQKQSKQKLDATAEIQVSLTTLSDTA